MSEDDDFERFLATARGEHRASAVPPETTRRIEESVAAHVSWRRALPAGIATALATTEASAAARPREEGSGGPSKSGPLTRAVPSKVIAVIAPVIGLAVVYSVTTARLSGPSSNPVELATPVPAAPIVEAAPATPPATAPSAEASLPTLAAPSELPDARDLPRERPNRPSTPAASSAVRRADGSLEAELALLAEVTSALQGNHPARALTLIDEHDRRFPKGALVPEFAAQRVVTLAALGRHGEACTRSTAFLAAYPKSPLVPQVRSSCVDPISNP